jgi:choline dehydrogenase-like flavoprotein
MIRAAREIPAGAVLDVDLCIVGGGPVGIVLARELSGKGASIALVENGGHTATKQAQLLTDTESVGYPYPRFPISTTSALGGNSHRWGANGELYWHALPLDRIDFEQRDGIPRSGWPFGRDVLVPYYARAQELFGVKPFDLSDSDVERDAATVLAIRDGKFVVRELRHGKLPFDRELELLAGAADVDVILHGHVSQILPDERDSDRVEGVSVLAEGGKRFVVRARTVLLATGGIGNARLLLLGNSRQPRGIGNEHDLVGRFFMEHTAVRSGVVFPRDGALLANPLMTVNDVDGVRSRSVLGPSDGVLRSEALPNTYLHLEARPRAFAATGVRSAAELARAFSSRPRIPGLPVRAARVARDLPAVVRTALAGRLGSANEVVVVRAQGEQVPNPDSRVTLSTATNEYGVRMARLDWRVTRSDLATIRRVQAVLGEELRSAGVGQLESLLEDERPAALVSGHCHHLGTTRMHDDPEQGVVDSNGRVHGLANLFVAGGSVFPTVGAANPTLTITALAIRLSDHLLGHLQAF